MPYQHRLTTCLCIIQLVRTISIHLNNMTLISLENRNSNLYRNCTYFGVSLKDLWFLISPVQLFITGKGTRISVFTVVYLLLSCRQYLYRISIFTDTMKVDLRLITLNFFKFNSTAG